MSRGPRKNKYVFSLSNINTEHIDQKYNISVVSNLMSNDVPQDKVTKVSELNIDLKNPESISFIDESKRSRHCTISCIDLSTNTSTDLLRYNCFWCRHNFDSRPIGCPVNYVHNKLVKSYYSELSKEVYTIKEFISNSKKPEKLNSNSQASTSMKLFKNNYYITDGVFCSFNCCRAFILDNKHNPTYDLSDMLLKKMYVELTGNKCDIIDPAPHWRMLNEYGGNMTINHFRKCFNKIEFDSHGTIKFMPLQHIFEEKIKF